MYKGVLTEFDIACVLFMFFRLRGPESWQVTLIRGHGKRVRDRFD
jgi:hypothetical protein